MLIRGGSLQLERVRATRAMPTNRAELAAFAARLNQEKRWLETFAQPSEATERMADVVDDAITLMLTLQQIMPDQIDLHQIPAWLRP